MYNKQNLLSAWFTIIFRFSAIAKRFSHSYIIKIVEIFNFPFLNIFIIIIEGTKIITLHLHIQISLTTGFFAYVIVLHLT